jgi:hypothetical protein
MLMPHPQVATAGSPAPADRQLRPELHLLTDWPGSYQAFSHPFSAAPTLLSQSPASHASGQDDLQQWNFLPHNPLPFASPIAPTHQPHYPTPSPLVHPRPFKRFRHDSVMTSASSDMTANQPYPIATDAGSEQHSPSSASAPSNTTPTSAHPAQHTSFRR